MITRFQSSGVQNHFAEGKDDSLVDTIITSIVWIGLEYSKRAPDARFHFGYFKVETLAVLIASVEMIASASALVYFSYFRMLEPRELSHSTIALVTLLLADTVALYRALQMQGIPRRHNPLSLKTDAANTMNKGLAGTLARLSKRVARWKHSNRVLETN